VICFYHPRHYSHILGSEICGQSTGVLPCVHFKFYPSSVKISYTSGASRLCSQCFDFTEGTALWYSNCPSQPAPQHLCLLMPVSVMQGIKASLLIKHQSSSLGGLSGPNHRCRLAHLMLFCSTVMASWLIYFSNR
jgi:hypothetical protein